MLRLNLTYLIDDAKCYETVRQMRWTTGVCCPKCKSSEVIKRGKDERQPARQRYQCKTCNANFDDIGVMLTKRFVMVRENMQEMKVVMFFVKFMSIPWKAFGRFCGLG